MRLFNIIISYIYILVCIFHPIDARTGGGGSIDDDEIFKPDNVSSPPSTPPSSPPAILLVPTATPTQSFEPTTFDVFPPISTPTASSNNCISVDGLFGIVNDNDFIVTYNYAVQLKEGTSESEFTSLLLPDLETSMIDAITPSLFDCSNRRKQRILSSLSSRRLMSSIVGINKIPIDTIVNDIECTTINCFVLFGTLTIHLDDSTTRGRRILQKEESHYTLVREALKESMDSGMFNTVSKSILNVTWVDDGSGESGVNKPDENEDDSTQRSASNNGQVIGWTVGLGAAGLLILLAAAAMRRRRNLSNDDQSEFQGASTTTSV